MSDYSKFPASLRNVNQSVVWSYEDQPRDGKRSKVCRDPKTNKRASVTDPNSWSSFERALRFYRATAKHGTTEGIGFVFTSDDDFVGIDLDHCIDPSTGSISEPAKSIVEAFHGTYIERSPSETGIHIICRGSIPHAIKNHNVEVYAEARYFTITCDVISHNADVVNCQPQLDELVRVYGTRPQPSPIKRTSKPRFRDQQIINRVRKAKAGRYLWINDPAFIRRYHSQSEIDFALCLCVANFTQNPKQIERIVDRSMIDKRRWNDARYRERTINRAIEVVAARGADRPHSGGPIGRREYA